MFGPWLKMLQLFCKEGTFSSPCRLVLEAKKKARKCWQIRLDENILT